MATVNTKRRHPWRRILIQAAGLYLLSRVLYVAIGLAISVFVHGTHAVGGGLHLSQPWHSFLFNLVYTSDSAFYHSIAMHGYRHVRFNTRKQYNWAFFPLYPYLTRWTRDLVHLRVVDSGVLWSQLSMVGFLTLVGRRVDRMHGDRLAFLAMALAAFSPLTPYFSAYRAGALFLALSMAVFYFLAQSQWGWAVLAGALASISRPVGILLAVPYLIAVYQAYPGWPARIWRGLAAAGYATGFFVVGAVDWRFTGNPLAFLAIQKAWNRKSAAPFSATVRWLGHLTVSAQGGWSFPALAIAASLLAIGAAIYLVRRDQANWPGAGYILITVLLANASNSFEGIPRFIAELPPMYWALALWLDESPKRQWLGLLIMGALFSAYVALWALGIHAVQN